MDTYRLSLWDPRKSQEATHGLSEVTFQGTETEAEVHLQSLVDSGEAVFGQLLADDGLVLKNYARPTN